MKMGGPWRSHPGLGVDGHVSRPQRGWRSDLYVCNDYWTPDRLWLNDGKGRFQAAPRLALRNMCASSMAVDFADIDRTGSWTLWSPTC